MVSNFYTIREILQCNLNNYLIIISICYGFLCITVLFLNIWLIILSNNLWEYIKTSLGEDFSKSSQINLLKNFSKYFQANLSDIKNPEKFKDAIKKTMGDIL
jgi:hypothetical protein